MGHRWIHKALEKKPEVDMVDHIQRVQEVIHKYLDDVPNSYLRLGENRALFFLLTLRGDPERYYRINVLDPKVQVFRG